jgi:hypothetical protein
VIFADGCEVCYGLVSCGVNQHETYLVASHFMLLADRPGVSDLAYRQAFSHCHFPKLFATISASTALRYTSLDIARPPYLFSNPCSAPLALSP